MSIYKGNTLIAGGSQVTPLLHPTWEDHLLNDISWLRADTFSWQAGTVYSAVYQHLVADIVGKSLQSETIAGTTIQFYLADDGHKITTDESGVLAIYNATGVAWYYILDTANTRFKLPRSENPHQNYIPNYEDNYKYLYFYVGQFTQSAISQTAGLNAELFNGKVDKGHQVIEFQAPTAANNYTWYRKYADGWVEQGGRATVGQDARVTINLAITMADTSYQILITANSGGTTRTGGDGNFTATPLSTTQFYWMNGDDFTSSNGWWQVSGMAQ